MSGARPRLLAVATVPPWPVTNGYSLRVYHLLRCLSRDWDVTLIAPRGADSDGVLPAAQGAVGWIETPWEEHWGFLPHQFDPAGLRSRVRDAVKETAPDACLLWGGTTFLIEEAGLPAPVLDKVDCGTLTHWRAGRRAKGLRERLAALRTVWAYLRYERQAVRDARFAVVVGPDDARALRRISGRDSVRIVPNGVVTGPPPQTGDECSEPTVIFTGVLRYPPNVEAVSWFSDRVWPAVRTRIPAARFVVAGRNPIASIRALDGRDGIVVRSNVTDLAAQVRSAWIGVAPMRSGSGIKNKVLEAWAEGKPVAMTALAANGLQMDCEQQALVGADAAELADRVVGLLQDDAGRRRLGRAAWEIAASRHAWAGAADQLTALLRDAMRQGRGGPRR